MTPVLAKVFVRMQGRSLLFSSAVPDVNAAETAWETLA